MFPYDTAARCFRSSKEEENCTVKKKECYDDSGTEDNLYQNAKGKRIKWSIKKKALQVTKER